MATATESTYTCDRQRERLRGLLLTAYEDSIMETKR